jgi:hypothetical protein
MERFFSFLQNPPKFFIYPARKGGSIQGEFMYNQPQNQVLNKPTAAYILSLIGVFSVAFTTIVVGNATVGYISYHTPLEYTNFRSQ